MMTIYEQRYYTDIAALRKAVQEQNEILKQLIEVINNLKNEKK